MNKKKIAAIIIPIIIYCVIGFEPKAPITETWMLGLIAVIGINLLIWWD